MRLPPFLTEIHPIRETLEAELQGEELLAGEIGHWNDQLSVSTADDGLRLWEADYGLPHAGDLTDRRTAIRTALSGDRTLTPGHLKELAETIGGAELGVVTESFPQWQVTLESLKRGQLPRGTAELTAAVERLAPAHLEVKVLPGMLLEAEHLRYTALTGGICLEIFGR